MYSYSVSVSPLMWFMNQTEDCRLFQHKTTQQILAALFKESGVTQVSFRLYAQQATREYTVQMNESDFAFADRLMQEEGWFWFFEHQASAHVLVITDGNVSFSAIAEPLVTLDAGSSDFSTLVQWSPVSATSVGQTALKDYDPTAPSATLQALQNTVDPVAGAAQRDVFRWPAHTLDQTQVDQRTRRMIEAAEASVSLIEGRGRHYGFVPGGKFTLAVDPQSQAKNQEHVIHTVVHQGREDSTASGGSGTAYANYFRCFPSGQTWRDVLTRRRPPMYGMYSATVIGPEGDEIYCDELGRVKLRFPWDRKQDSTATGSIWVRVVQPWAGNGWGMQFLPRVGSEVAVAFMDGDPDRPVVVGGLYNGHDKPPFTLPAQKTRSGLRTRSTLKGGTADYSEFSIDDAKGHEQVLLHAQKNHTVEVEASQSISVGGVRSVSVGAAEHVSIAKGNKKATDDGTITFSTDVMEGDAALVVHHGRYNVVTKKEISLQCTEGDIELLAQAKNVNIGAPAGILAEKSPTITRNGGTITDEGDTSIELKVGQNSIKITKDGIVISGLKVTVHGTTLAEVTGPIAQVVSTGQTVIKGPMVMIN